jgi:hypothetical protein
MSTSTLVPHIENSEKKDHEVPAVTENGMVWKSPSMATVATNRHCHCNTYATRNYTMEGSAVAHFIVNMGAGNGLFIVGM